MDDEILIDLILSYMPEAQIERSPHINSSYKIRVPIAVNKMPGYQELRKALKDHGVKPMCTICHKGNTKFRYFDNNSSLVLQARYKCLDCNNYFTLGGKQYSKDQNCIAKDDTNIVDSIRRSKRFMEVDDLETEIVETKRRRRWAMTSGDMSKSKNFGNNIEIYPDFLLPTQQSRVDQYLRVDLLQEQQRQFGEQLTHGTHYLHPLPPIEVNLMKLFSSNPLTDLGTTNYTNNIDSFPLGWHSAATYSSCDRLQLLVEQSKALTLPYMQPPRVGNVASDSNISTYGSEKQVIDQSAISDELKALLSSPGKESSIDIWTLITKMEKQ